MTDDDAELVALIDNELDESRRTVLLARLGVDERLRHRYEELRQLPRRPPPHLTPCLGKLLSARSGRAPRGRKPSATVEALLRDRPPGPCGGHYRDPRRRRRGMGRVEPRAAQGTEDWRSAITDYTDIYTNETFSL